MKFKNQEFQWTDSFELMLALTTIVRGYGSQKKTAEALGISPQYLHDILSGKRDIGTKIAAHFGVRPIRIFVPIEDDMKAKQALAGQEEKEG